MTLRVREKFLIFSCLYVAMRQRDKRFRKIFNFKLGFCSDTYLPFRPKSRFLLFIFLEVIPQLLFWTPFCHAPSRYLFIHTGPLLHVKMHHYKCYIMHHVCYYRWSNVFIKHILVQDGCCVFT